MAKSINLVVLVGRLGKDAETRLTPSGVSVTSFSVATDRSWKDQSSGEWKSETNWANVVAWRIGVIGEKLLKGAQVAVNGRLQTRSYDDRNGEKRWITEVVADSVVLCGGQSEGDNLAPRSRSTAPSRGDDFEPGITDDPEDIPF